MPKIKEAAVDPEIARRKSLLGPEIDYAALKKADVIMHSLDARKAAGSLTSTTPADKSKQEVVFKLRIKGEMPKIKEVAIDPELAKQRAAEGPVIDHAKLKKEDVIMHSLDERKAAGSLTSTTAADKSKKDVVFTLRVKGEMPKLKEVAEDPELAKQRAAEGPVIDHAKLKKEDLIFHSLDARKAAGSLTSTVPADKSKKDVVFTLRQTGEGPILAEVAEDPELAAQRAAEGPVVDHAKLKREDLIMHSLDARKAAGSITSTTAKTDSQEVCFSLKLTNKIVLAERVINPEQA